MGIADRDYVQNRPVRTINSMRLWNVTTWLVIINIVVFLVQSFLLRANKDAGMAMISAGNFTLTDGLLHFQLWRLITFQFLHANWVHIGFNMLALWFAGPIVEQYVGRGRFIVFYFLCGIAGAMTYAVIFATIAMFTAHSGPTMDVGMIGASAGIFGVLLAAAHLEPNRQVFVFFVQMTLRTFVWLLMALALYIVLMSGSNWGGQAAHLGGGLLGWFWIRQKGSLGVMPFAKVERGRRFKDLAQDFNR